MAKYFFKEICKIKNSIKNWFHLLLLELNYTLATSFEKPCANSSLDIIEKVDVNNQGYFENKEVNLGSYLAGLLEGDGYLSITNENRVIIGITFNSKDTPLAEKLLELIGKGTIVKRSTNSVELRFSAKESIIKIVNLINGKFRTPKISQLHLLIDWLNNKHNINISKLPADSTPLNQNGWLAGFIEADGNFFIGYSEKPATGGSCSHDRKSRNTAPSSHAFRMHDLMAAGKFNLEQRMIYLKTLESYDTILSQICLFLNVKLAVRDRSNHKNPIYIIRVENQGSVQILIDYLNKYPLLSSKRMDFKDWEKSFSLIVEKKHLTEQGKELILAAKNSMNDKRTCFNWDYLNL